MRRKIIHNFLHGQLFFHTWFLMQFYFLFHSCLASSPCAPTTQLLVGKLVFRPNEFCQPFHFRSLFLYGTVAVQSFRDINWPICMFQWASERKWHLQSFLFLGRERIIALHCFKAYQVTSKAFQHPFLAAGRWRRCSSALSLALLTLSFKFMKPLSWPHEQLLIFVLHPRTTRCLAIAGENRTASLISRDPN